jgi:cytochrome c oxidase cbb3-type subunit 1
MGWVGFVTFGAVYCLVPWLWKRERLYSMVLVSWHFWIATMGIVLYITSMWVSGILQGLMWRAYDAQGFLQYSFVETVAAMHPFYIIRALGGLLYLTGTLIMVYNCWRTIRGEVRQGEPILAGSTFTASAPLAAQPAE